MPEENQDKNQHPEQSGNERNQEQQQSNYEVRVRTEGAGKDFVRASAWGAGGCFGLAAMIVGIPLLLLIIIGLLAGWDSERTEKLPETSQISPRHQGTL